MCYVGILKRTIPFVLTFAAGLFLASFFVPVALPGGPSGSTNSVEKQLRAENEELRSKYRALRKQNEELLKSSNWDTDALLDDAVPPPDFDAHHPPKRPKQPRFGTER